MPEVELQSGVGGKVEVTVVDDGRLQPMKISCVCSQSLKNDQRGGEVSRVGVVAITLASHARGRGFNPRIRYFFLWRYR